MKKFIPSDSSHKFCYYECHVIDKNNHFQWNIFTVLSSGEKLSLIMEKKKTNKRQFAWLVSFMEKYPELARGGKFTDSRESTSTLWAQAQTSLNSLGPPTRSVVQWQKVWTDKKLQLKKKLQHNSNEVRATGGGRNTQYSFTDLEEAIIRLLSLERLVNHSGAVFGTQTSPVATSSREQPRQIPCDDDYQGDEGEPMRNNLSNQQEEVGAREDGVDRGHQPTPLRSRVNKRNYRKTLLEKQTKDLGRMKTYVSDCARYARKSFNIHQQRFAVEEKRLRLDEEKFRFEKQMRLEELKQRGQHLQLKMKTLELKKQKLDFQMGQTAYETPQHTDHEEEMQQDDRWDE